MFRKLLVWILRKSYNKTILRVLVLDKSVNKYYKDLEPFCTLEVATDLGPFIFQFREDRRKSYMKFIDRMFIRTYIVHLNPPPGLKPTKVDLSEKIVLAVKVMIFRPNYEVLTQVLIDIYLDVMLNKS